MSVKVDLVWLGTAQKPEAWALGEVHIIEAQPRLIAALIDQMLTATSADAWLFWHSRLGTPNAKKIARAYALPGNVWHAGLRLGMGGAPGIIDFISGTWMLNRDPDEEVESTSWRLSLEACLIPTDVLRQMGGPHRNSRRWRRLH